MAGVVDGALDVQLHLRPELVGVETEPPESHLELADVQHIVLTEILKIPQGQGVARLSTGLAHYLNDLWVPLRQVVRPDVVGAVKDLAFQLCLGVLIDGCPLLLLHGTAAQGC